MCITKIVNSIFGKKVDADKLLDEKITKITQRLESVREILSANEKVYVTRIIMEIKNAGEKFNTLSVDDIEAYFANIDHMISKIADSARGVTNFNNGQITSHSLDNGLSAYLNLLFYYVGSNIRSNNAPIKESEMKEFLDNLDTVANIEKLKLDKDDATTKRNNYRKQRDEIKKKMSDILNLVRSGKLEDYEIDNKEEEYGELEGDLASVEERIAEQDSLIDMYKDKITQGERYGAMIERVIAINKDEVKKSQITTERMKEKAEEINKNKIEQEIAKEEADATYKSSMGDTVKKKTSDAFKAARATGNMNSAKNSSEKDSIFDQARNKNSNNN